ncbi:hypothetical protein ACEZDB_24610 [Streptacidiphilus sp. N1-3]|uniref:Uncharacterized protein n=1 Tax=Streptacidiphilus alkalitolerans TaxID=3342712 RepID=A0ABV6X6D7_9ACTN
MAAAVLAVNDHLLKQIWPGPVTGKLSDLAGMLVAPPLLALVLSACLRRGDPDRLAAFSLGAVGLGFAAVKCSDVCARLAAEAWPWPGPSHITADPTDLLALPALWLARLVWTRARRRPATALAVRRVTSLIAVPLMVLAVAATTETDHFAATSVGTTADGSIVITVRGNADGGPWYRTSTDGGVTWRQPATVPEATVTADACVPGQPALCYRVGLGAQEVQQTTDGGTHWSTVWRLSPGRQVYLRRELPDNPLKDAPPAYGSTSVAVARVPGGYRVVVADQQDGLLVRDATGRWQRRGFTGLDVRGHALPAPGATPLTGGFGPIGKELLLAVFAGWLAWLLGTSAALIRRAGPGLRRRVVRWEAPRWLVVTGLAVFTAFISDQGRWRVEDNIGLDSGFVLLFLYPASALVTLQLRPTRWARSLVLPLTGVCIGTAMVFLLPFLGWSSGSPDSYTTALTVSLALLAPCLLAAGGVGWARAHSLPRLRPRPRLRPPRRLYHPPGPALRVPHGRGGPQGQ